MKKHQKYIQRCFDLAQIAAGSVTPNPRVGAVVVHNNKIIGEGYHQFPGGPHAEINAINSLKDKGLLSSSTIYVSLEPCNNHGRTPPCVEAILKYKIPKVVISVIDPNPLTKGKSVNKLKSAGVDVTINVLGKKGKKVSPGFYSTLTNQRPYIILKYAQSVNKKIGIAGENYWISNPFTKRLTHKWRAETNAIIVGTQTLLVDNPKLNNRLYFGKSPVKIALKRDGILPKDVAMFQTSGRSIIVSEPGATIIKEKNVEQWLLPFDASLLTNILKNLTKAGLNSLLVEGGATLINHFIRQDLWDEARVFTGNTTINHSDSIDAPDLNGILVNSYQIGDNKLDLFSKTGA